jgi:hypothetical protein
VCKNLNYFNFYFVLEFFLRLQNAMNATNSFRYDADVSDDIRGPAAAEQVAAVPADGSVPVASAGQVGRAR